MHAVKSDSAAGAEDSAAVAEALSVAAGDVVALGGAAQPASVRADAADNARTLNRDFFTKLPP